MRCFISTLELQGVTTASVRGDLKKGGAYMSLDTILMIGIVVVIVLLLVKRNGGSGKNKIADQIDKAMDFSENSKSEEVVLTKKEQRLNNLEIQIIRAGFPLKAAEFKRFRLIATLVVILLFTFLAGNIVLGVMFGGLVFMAPNFLLKHSIEKKRQLFEAQIPAALSLIRNSVESGFSFMQAVEVVATEMDAPISEEFSRVLHEASVGKDVEVALNNMQQRVLSDELKLVIVAVLIQRQVGGNLGKIIEVILETIQDRIQIKGEIKTLTSQGRLSAIVITLLPIILGIVMYLMNPEYMSPMLTTTIGQILLGVCFVMMLLGAFLISKIIKIDF